MFVANPTSIIPTLSKLKNFFSKPQYFHFTRYITGLITSEKGKKNIQSMNCKFIERKDQSSMNRFLTKSNWNVHQFNEYRLKTLLKRRVGGYLCLDDSIIEKTGNRIDGVGFVYDAKQRKSVLGHNIVSTHYINGDYQIPINIGMYQKKGSTDNFRTKIEIGMGLISNALHHLNKPTMLFDGWYLTKKMIRFIKQRGLDWISRLKSNRMVEYSGEWINAKKLTRHIDFEPCNVEISKKKYKWIGSCATSIKDIGRANIVVLMKSMRDKRPVIIASNKLNCDALSIVLMYKKRNSIDVFYRDCKQHLGLGEYQLRNMNGVVKHLHLVFLAYSLLRDAVCRKPKWINRVVKTIGEACRALKEKVVEKLISYAINMPSRIKGIFSLKSAKVQLYVFISIKARCLK